ncbi:MAG: hypothetical protein IKL54_08380 [Bacteroidaceae bacterium]|nr:hypothetical protein [Bacteroidaceae bacterium]
MISNNENNRSLTREVLEEFCNKCADMSIYAKDSDEYIAARSELYSKVWEYRHISDYEHIVKEGGNEGVKNEFLNYHIVPPVFDKVIGGTNAGRNYIVANDGKYGIVKGDGQAGYVIPCIYDKIETLDTFCDIVKFESNGKCGIIEFYGNRSAVVTIEPIYDEIAETGTGFLLLEKDGKQGLYCYGYLLPAEYDRIFIPEVLGWIKVLKNGVWGYIDAKNNFTKKLEEAFLYSGY